MLGSNAVVDMDHNIIENRHVFMKTDKTIGEQFCRFIENQIVEFDFFLNLGNFEIKNSKKLECVSRFLVKTEFKNSK
jgi:hypothetical protein